MISPSLRRRPHITGRGALVRALSRRPQQTGGDSRSLGHCGGSNWVHGEKCRTSINAARTQPESTEATRTQTTTQINRITNRGGGRVDRSFEAKKFPGRTNVAPGDDESPPASVIRLDDTFTRPPPSVLVLFVGIGSSGGLIVFVFVFE